MAIAQGACPGLRELVLFSDDRDQTEISSEQMHCLVGALEAERALPVLEVLKVRGGELPGSTAYILLEALRRGAVPNLRTLWLRGEAAGFQDDTFEDVVLMLEERSGRPHCRGFEELFVGGRWGGCSQELRVRYLRALLSSFLRLSFQWDEAYEACFADGEISGAKYISLTISEGEVAPSTRVFESMPALTRFELRILPSEDDSLFSMTSIISALQEGVVFQRLTAFLILGEYHIDNATGKALLDALAGAACAPSLRLLVLHSCDIAPTMLRHSVCFWGKIPRPQSPRP